MKSNSEHMISRLGVYIKEMFPLQMHIPFALLLFYCQWLLVRTLSEGSSWDERSILGFITVLCITLLMRIADEFKDREVDKLLFPDRPFPRGAVKAGDLRTLAMGLILLIVVCNAWDPILLLALGIVLGYVYLTYRWFFIEERMRPSLFLAFISHQPLALIINAYIVFFTLRTQGVELPENLLQLGLIALWFWIPILAWEVARKVRAPEQETEYVTYSKLLGVPGVLLFLGLLLTVGVLLALYFGQLLGLGLSYFVIWYAVAAFVVFVFIRFGFSPSSRTNMVLNTTLIFILAMLANLIGHLIPLITS